MRGERDEEERGERGGREAGKREREGEKNPLTGVSCM